jgi:hypothetical protein
MADAPANPTNSAGKSVTRYVTFHACPDAVRGDSTCIGVAVYDADGRFYRNSFDVWRAVSRGDMDARKSAQELEQQYAGILPTVEAVERFRDTMAHMMSGIQVGSPCVSILPADRLYADSVRRFLWKNPEKTRAASEVI